MLRLSVLLGAAVLVSAVPTSVRADDCHSAHPNERRYEDYAFALSSWVRKGQGVHVYQTCAENLSVDRWLWVDWFVPGPRGYLQPGEKRPSTRYFTTRETQDLNGCLEYGNHHTPTKELYLGHKKDVPLVTSDPDCKRKVTASSETTIYQEAAQTQACVAFDPISKKCIQTVSEPSDEFREIASRTHLFVPADATQIEETMMRVDIQSSLVQKDKQLYITAVQFTAVPVAQSFSASIGEVTFRTSASEGNTAALLASVVKDGQPLREKNFFEFKSEVSGEMGIENASLGFFDRGGRFVGSVFFPVAVGQRN